MAGALIFRVRACGTVAGADPAGPRPTPTGGRTAGRSAASPQAAPAASPQAAPANATPAPPGDPFGEESTLAAKPIVYVKGTGTWDNAFETITGSLKKLKAYVDKQGLKTDGLPMTIFTVDRRYRL